MSKRSADDYANALFESVKIISESLLEGLKYDRTVEATIIDDSQREQGIYVVSDGSTRFKAFSENTKYRKNNVVYITIPNGDFDNDKIITGKKMKNDEIEPFIYNSPFSNLINVSGNLIPENKQSGGLVANKPSNYYEPYYGDIDDYNKYYIKVNGTYQIAPGEGYDVYYIKHTDGLSVVLMEETELASPYYRFTRLGLQADFQAWLMEHDCISGNYGLKLTVFFLSDSSLADEEQKITVRELYLDTNDMIGNPYQFESHYTQAKLFDITNFGGVYKIKLEFFQDAGSFYDKNGNLIPYLDDFENILLPNLFVKNCKVCIGYNADDFKEDFLQLYSFSPNTYTSAVTNIEKNKKDISLIWVHIDENGNQIQMNKDSAEKFEIRWYRYLLGESSADAYCGAGWTALDHPRNVGVFKVVDDDYFKTTLQPDVALVSTERIKVIIFLGDPPNEGEVDNRQILRSQPIEFYNEKTVANSATLDALQALTLVCMDEIDGAVIDTYGNYLIYDQGNTLIDKAQAQITRLIGCHLDLSSTTGIDTESLTKDAIITWRFPLENTMIKPLGYQEIKTENGYGLIEMTKEDINNQFYGKYGCPIFKYTIETNYSPTKANNFIECSVLKEGITYRAIKELTFGQSSTAGTEWTFVIDFDKNVNAVLANQKNGMTYGLTARLYDSTGQELDIKDKEIEWSFVNSQDSSVDNDPINNIGMQLVDNDNILPSNQRTLIVSANLSINQLFIVKAKLINWGDFELTAYLPIPIRASEEYLYVSGPTQIIYLTDSTPIYYNKFYELHTVEKNITDQVVWQEYYNLPEITAEDMNFPENATEVEKEELRQKEILKRSGNLLKYFPTVAIQKDIDGNIVGYKLKPVNMYIDGLPLFGVQCKATDGTILWTQPILIIQNRYPSAMVNAWNGKELVLNENEGAILANMIGAGKKENDNSFTGVMMGDWAEESIAGSILNSKVGLYGFQKGEMSFSFTEDGNATIGKASGSQLVFDGNKSTIASGSYLNYVKAEEQQGMMLDFDNNQILAKVNGNTIFQLQSQNPYFRINSIPYEDIDGGFHDSKTLMYIGDKNFYLQSENYNLNKILFAGEEEDKAKYKGDGMKINLYNGALEATQGKFFGNIMIYKNDGTDFVYKTYSYDPINNKITEGEQSLNRISLADVIIKLLSTTDRANIIGETALSVATTANDALARVKTIVNSDHSIIGNLKTAYDNAEQAKNDLSNYFALTSNGVTMRYGANKDVGKVYATNTNAGFQAGNGAHLYVSGNILYFNNITSTNGAHTAGLATESFVTTEIGKIDIPDVSSFITANVSNLTNYYTKTYIDGVIKTLTDSMSNASDSISKLSGRISILENQSSSYLTIQIANNKYATIGSVENINSTLSAHAGYLTDLFTRVRALEQAQG